MKNNIVILFLLMCVVTPKDVLAGYYKMIEGQGVQVCDAYYQYLKTRNEPMPCEREFPPEISQLKRPLWQQLDVNKNKLLVLRIENYLQIPKDAKSTQPWIPVWREDDIDNYHIATQARLFEVDLDIDNDNKNESLIKYRSHACQAWDLPGKGPRWVAPILVVDAAGQRINRIKTSKLMQNNNKVYVSNIDEIEANKIESLRIMRERKEEITRLQKGGMSYNEIIQSLPRLALPKVETRLKSTIYAAGTVRVQGYDIFYFKNKIYFDKWNEMRGDEGFRTLTVYINSQGKVNNLCEYKYFE